LWIPTLVPLYRWPSLYAVFLSANLPICDWKNGLFSGTYPLIYSEWLVFLYSNSLCASIFLESISLAYNEVHLYSWIVNNKRWLTESLVIIFTFMPTQSDTVVLYTDPRLLGVMEEGGSQGFCDDSIEAYYIKVGWWSEVESKQIIIVWHKGPFKKYVIKLGEGRV